MSEIVFQHLSDGYELSVIHDQDSYAIYQKVDADDDLDGGEFHSEDKVVLGHDEVIGVVLALLKCHVIDTEASEARTAEYRARIKT